MVLADRGLVWVVAAGIADPGVNLLDFGFGLFPVVREFGQLRRRQLLKFFSNCEPCLIGMKA